MGLLKILKYPDPLLAKKAQPIERMEHSLHADIDSMLETMYHAPGIGLAANQVGWLKQLLVLDIDYSSDASLQEEEGLLAEPAKKNPKILINPKIIYREGKTVYAEACLSVPDFQSEVRRAEKIKVKYLDLDGTTKILAAEDLLAIVIQHEMDHLEGKLFIDRISPLKKHWYKRHHATTSKTRK